MSEFPYHPHADESFHSDNALYLPAKSLSLDSSKNGYGILNYSPLRQLTKEGHPRSEWNLPNCFYDVEMTYHDALSYGWQKQNSYFKSANQGQEFIIKSEATDSMLNWLLSVIS